MAANCSQPDMNSSRRMRAVLSDFQSNNPRGAGQLPVSELLDVLTQVGLQVSENELKRFLDAHDLGDGKTVVLSQFLSKVFRVGHTNKDMKTDPTSQYLGHPLRALSVEYFSDKLINETIALGNGMGPQSSVYDIEGKVIREKGKRLICPRDAKEGAAYVDCVFGEHNVGLAVIMLSYTWGYKLKDIADGLMEFCKDKKLNPKYVYTWMCVTCINQHRVKEAKTVPFEQFRSDFSSRVKGVGKIVSLMAPWKAPNYIKRVWCDFEMFTAMELRDQDCRVSVTMPAAEKADLFRCLCDAEGIDAMWKTLMDLQVEKAEASYKEDKDRIFEMIEKSVGFHQVNVTLSSYLQQWIVQTCERHLEEELAQTKLQSLEGIKLRVIVAQMLRKIGLDDMLHRAEGHLKNGLCQAEQLAEIPPEVNGMLKRELGMVQLSRGERQTAEGYIKDALSAFEESGKMNTSEGVQMLIDIGTMYRKHEMNQEAETQFERARKICLGLPSAEQRPVLGRERSRGSDDLKLMEPGYEIYYARVLKGLGDTKRRMKDEEGRKSRMHEAVSHLQTAREVMTELGTLETPGGAELLVSLGLAINQCNEKEHPVHDDPAELFKKAKNIRERTNTLQSHDGGKLLCSLGILELSRNLQTQAEQTLKQAKKIFEKTDTLFTPIGRKNMTTLGDLCASQKRWHEALVAYEEAQLISLRTEGEKDAKVDRGIQVCKEEGDVDRDKLENLGEFLVPAGGLTVATWNVAAADTNPFEFWVSHDDKEYQNLMTSYEQLVMEKGSDKDVPMHAVFSDALFLELLGLMKAEEWEDTDAVEEAWWNVYRNKKVLSEFMTDKELGEKRLVSMADLVTSRVESAGSCDPAFRPTVVNHYGGDLLTMDQWWLRWRNFIFHETMDISKEGRVEKKRPCQMLKKLSREKYSALSKEEEQMSIPLQCLCLALYDSILVWIMMQIGAAGHWQKIKRSVTDITVKHKHSNILKILTKSACADVICLQKATAELKRFLKVSLGVEYHILRPNGYEQMISFSMVLLRKTKFPLLKEEVSPLKSSCRDITDECMKELGAEKKKIEAGELFAVCVTDTLDRPFMIASYHADSKGETTKPLLTAFDKVRRKSREPYRVIFGIDAETKVDAKKGELDVYDFLKFLDTLTYRTAFKDPDMKNNCTTCKARTFLQPQLQKGRKWEDRLTADTNPRDHLIFRDTDFGLLSSVRDNTGQGTYLDNHNMPCLQNHFPSDHGLLRVCLQPKDNGALILKDLETHNILERVVLLCDPLCPVLHRNSIKKLPSASSNEFSESFVHRNSIQRLNSSSSSDLPESPENSASLERFRPSSLSSISIDLDRIASPPRPLSTIAEKTSSPSGSRLHLPLEQTGSPSGYRTPTPRAAELTPRPDHNEELILGSLNIIGESYNPLEFTPAPVDLEMGGGGKKWEHVTEELSAKFDEYTIAQAREDVVAGEVPKALEIFDKFVSEAGLTAELKIAKLAETNQIDLALDNKWLPKDGRMNPLIFALSVIGRSESDGDDVNARLHINSCLRDPLAYRKQILSFYATTTLQTKESPTSVPSLLLWDLLCFHVVRAAPRTVVELASFSFMCEPKGKEWLCPVSRESMLRAIFRPLKILSESRQQQGTPIIIGCQEMPLSEQEVNFSLPRNFKTERMQAGDVDESTMSGFVYTGVQAFVDVTEKIRGDLRTFLKELGVDDKVTNTTTRKLCAGEFTMLPGYPVPKIAVIDFHCKSFGSKIVEEAKFVKQALRLAQEKCGCPAFGVGDMNIQAKWPRGTNVSQMMHAVSKAEKGMMPEDVRGLVSEFGAELKGLGITAAPAAGTLTTLKRRTRFQGQPNKEGELAAVQKDFVFVPDAYKVAWYAVGGCPELEVGSTNIELLQPSRYWPGDHFAVLCGIRLSEFSQSVEGD